MANTIIQFKRSANTAVPPNGALAAGQPGYSFLSDKMFVGNTSGDGILEVGGFYFMNVIANATSANNANNLVQRDINGDFAGGVITADSFVGTATLASALTPGAYIASGGEITGNVAFDGSSNINLALVLDATGVTAATYGAGDGSALPVITVDSKGRIILASNAAVAAGSNFTVKGNNGSDLLTSGDYLNIYGGDGASAAVTSNTGNTIVEVSVDSTVVRTTGDQSIAGLKTFTDDMTISANLTVSGTTTYVNTTQLDIGDNMVVLNADLPIASSPTEDSGIEINRGDVNGNAAIYWDETNDWWTAQANILATDATTLGRIHTDGYANATALSTGTVPSARIAGSYTGITGVGTITAGTWNADNVGVQWGGTGRADFTLGAVVYGNSTGDLAQTAAATEGQILQGDASGLPTFAMIDGGLF